MKEQRKYARSDSLHYKDEILDHLARQANVAQFVSFAPFPSLQQRFCHIKEDSHTCFPSVESAVHAILRASPDGMVNIRSFRPEQPKGGDFVYGLNDATVVVEHLQKLASSGYFTIVNETVNILDGGVSGVVFGDLIEFAPQDTPRCVEKPGTCRFPRKMGTELLAQVYGFDPDLNFSQDLRVEFSLHPLRRGIRHDHTIIWEIERVGDFHAQPTISWPNSFSRFLGDKAFGLLVADSLGLPVPHTTLVGRQLAPFTFGKSTGTSERWIRTCPVVPEPGKFTTQRGWIDPFRLLNEEDGNEPYSIASILAQEGVESVYAGALVASEQGEVLIEGVSGKGDQFMLGKRAPELLPPEITAAVGDLFQRARDQLGLVRLEWVFDGKEVWIVQLHKGSVNSITDTIVPGQPSTFHEFDVSLGLEALRLLIPEVQLAAEGIILIGDVGITSHFGDLLRRAGVPSRLVKR